MIFAFFGAFKIDSFGRRPMMLTSLTGMLFCGFVPWTICSAIFAEHGNHGAGYASVAFIFIFSAFYATTWNGILTGYTVECMSYDIRPKLICTQNLLVQAMITGLNYANPVALKNLGWKYYIIIDVIIAVNIAVVYFTYPETSRITLEEVAVIFDGPRAVSTDVAIKSGEEEGAVDEEGKAVVVQTEFAMPSPAAGSR